MKATRQVRLTDRQIVLISRALADPRRYKIFRQIASGKCIACTEVRAKQPVTAATLSHHAKELETAGLIRIAHQGKFANFTVQRGILQAYLDHLGRI